MNVYPAVDLREGRCVRLRQGDYAQETRYGDDPAAVAERWKQAGAAWLHVVDLDGAKAGRPVNAAVIGEIVRRSGLRVQAGGGVRTAADARRLLDLGATRVIVGSRAAEDWDGFVELVGAPGLSGRVALGVDARDGLVSVHGWTATTAVTAIQLARRAEPLGLPAIIFTDIARDGMMTGPNLAATQALAAAVRTPIIHSGGVTTLADVQALSVLPIDGFIIGRALYEGTIDLAAAIKTAATTR
jgi:phosphoribosylformimino-5-aminoimidazole carboxamide ribotide isomerase